MADTDRLDASPEPQFGPSALIGMYDAWRVQQEMLAAFDRILARNAPESPFRAVDPKTGELIPPPV